MNFNNILQSIKGLFQPKQIVSPIPPEQEMTSGLEYKTKFDDVRERQAQAANQAAIGQPTPTPYSITGAIDNRRKMQDNAVSMIRKYRPEFKESDDNIRKLYDKYGEKLLSNIYESLGNVTKSPQVAPQRVMGASTQPSTGQLPTGGYEQMHPNFDELLNTYVFPHTRPSYIPDSIAASQTAIESGWGKSPAAENQNNLHGIMQWNDAGQRSLRSFDSASDSAKMYADTVTSILRKKGYDPAQMTDDEIIEALQAGGKPRYEGDNPNPQHYVDTIKGMGIYKKYKKR